MQRERMRHLSQWMTTSLTTPMARAVGVAGLIIMVLAVAVLLPLRSSTPPDVRSSVPHLVSHTPTPRAATPVPATPTARAVLRTWASPAASLATPEVERPRIAATPQPTVIAIREPTQTPQPTDTPTPEPAATPTSPSTSTASLGHIATPIATPAPTLLYEASLNNELSALGGPSWSADGRLLVNDGAATFGHPWLVLPVRIEDQPAYALEAQMRVRGLATGVCDQSFGVVVQPGGEWPAWGGSILFDCAGTGPHARITEVSNWATGYNRDPEFGRADFDPGGSWHTYRLEVRGSAIRLLIDGTMILEVDTSPVTGRPVEQANSQVGLWSQGVRLEVRQVAVVELEP